jgi:hypothetical protein
MIRYIIPSVGQTLRLERRCPHCQRVGGNIHTAVYRRAVSDVKVTAVPQMRMRCPFCKATWTIRPDGISDGRQRSDRLIIIGVVLYMFGLSYRAIEKFLPLLGCIGSKSTIERDVGAVGAKARKLHLSAPRLQVRVLGVDGTGAGMAGKNAGLLFFVDVDGGRLICVEPVKESESAKLRRHVQKVMAMVGAEELRSDELSVYDHVMPEGMRKICLSHWLRSKCRRARQLHNQLQAEGMSYEAEQMLELIKYLKIAPRPPTVPDEVSRMGRRFINCRKGILWQVNKLLQHIERTWEDVSSDPSDPTNNATERIIGLDYKIRVKTTRGMKSTAKILDHCYLAEYLRAADGVCDLRKVI